MIEDINTELLPIAECEPMIEKPCCSKVKKIVEDLVCGEITYYLADAVRVIKTKIREQGLEANPTDDKLVEIIIEIDREFKLQKYADA